MDITDPSSPKLMWHKDSSSSGFSQLGQSWAEPQIAYSKLNVSGNNAAPVLFIGGGYDPAKDSTGVGGNDTVGKAIYMLDAATGNILWSLEPSGGTTTFSGTDSIPSEIAILDSDGDGLVDRLYAGDTGGNVWRIDMPSDNPNSSTEPWTVFKLASLGGGDNDIDRRFFYAPSIVRTFITETIETSVTDENGVTTQIKVKQEKPYDAILIASGDRSNPLGDDTNDMLFMLKDEHIKTQSFTSNSLPAIPTAITVDELYDYTNNPFKDYISSESSKEKVGLSASQKSALESLSLAVSEKSGWFINLVKAGEKSTSTPIAINGIAYFVTYTPPFVDPGVCNMPSGLGSTYVVDLILGIKKYNIQNTKGVTTRADDERVLDISHDWIDGASLIVPPSPNVGTTESEGSLIFGYQVLPVGFDLHTMRTSLYVTED
jgi:type IV pilus assembly protein PilY1